MMTTAFRQALVDLIWKNTSLANVGDATGLVGATVPGSFYFSLHTTFPGLAGSQNTNAAAYTGYAYVGVARSALGFSRSGLIMSPVSHIEFPKCTGGGAESSYFAGVGSASSGAGNLFMIAGLGPDPIPFNGATNDDLIAPELANQTPAWAVNDRVAFYALTGGASLPTGITEGTIYFVKTLSSVTFTISATQGGSVIDITAIGSGLVQKLVGVTATPPNGVPRIENTSRFYML